MNPRHRTAITPDLPRRGFTLLELMLASLLATVLLAAVWVVLKMELRFFELGRNEVESAQLARALVDRITDDLRDTVVCADPRASMNEGAPSSLSDSTAPSNATIAASRPLNPLLELAGQSSQPTSGAATGGITSSGDSSNRGSVAGSGVSGSLGMGTISSTPDSGEIWSARCGLIGTSQRLQLDVRPREDETDLQRLTEPAGLHTDSEQALPVTVIYEFHADPSMVTSGGFVSAAAPLSGAMGQPIYGLLRREIDAAQVRSGIEELSNEETAALEPDRFGEDGNRFSHLEDAASRTSLIPEVALMRFRYSDGTTWTESWDSRQRGGLPVAVEIALTFHKSGENQTAAAARPRMETYPLSVDGLDPEDPLFVPDFRVVIDIPAGRRPEPTTTESEAGASGGFGDATLNSLSQP